jgi:hypothetical protein
MNLHIEALPGASDMIAILYGPIVLAGALGTKVMPDVYNHDYHTRMARINWSPAPPVPVLVGTERAVLAGIQSVDGKPLTFRTNGIGSPYDVELIPFYRMHHQRYTVYWQLVNEAVQQNAI